MQAGEDASRDSALPCLGNRPLSHQNGRRETATAFTSTTSADKADLPRRRAAVSECGKKIRVHNAVPDVGGSRGLELLLFLWLSLFASEAPPYVKQKSLLLCRGSLQPAPPKDLFNGGFGHPPIRTFCKPRKPPRGTLPQETCNLTCNLPAKCSQCLLGNRSVIVKPRSMHS